MRFACFKGGYRGHEGDMQEANLQPSHNLWFAVFDFNDEGKTGKNWRIMSESEEADPWYPMGSAVGCCCPRVLPGSIPLPSQGSDPTQSGGMMSFGINTTMHDAAKATGDEYTAQETRDGKKGKGGGNRGGKGTGGKVGWNPAALSGGDEGGGSKPNPKVESDKNFNKPAAKKSRVGWNPDAISSPSNEASEGNSGDARVGKPPRSKVGWNPGGSSASDAEPSSSSSSSSSHVASVSSAKKGKSKIGWNPDALNDDRVVATRCDDPVAPRARSSSSSSQARQRADSDFSNATSGERGVTLELQALMLFAVEKGVDVVKWFQPDDEEERKLCYGTFDGKVSFVCVCVCVCVCVRMGGETIENSFFLSFFLSRLF